MSPFLKHYLIEEGRSLPKRIDFIAKDSNPRELAAVSELGIASKDIYLYDSTPSPLIAFI
jgi:hypothetical protein